MYLKNILSYLQISQVARILATRFWFWQWKRCNKGSLFGAGRLPVEVTLLITAHANTVWWWPFLWMRLKKQLCEDFWLQASNTQKSRSTWTAKWETIQRSPEKWGFKKIWKLQDWLVAYFKNWTTETKIFWTKFIFAFISISFELTD